MKYYNALVECVENKKKIRCSAWQKGEYIYHVSGKEIDVSAWVGHDDLTDSERLRGYVTLSGHIDKMTHNNVRIIGWAPSPDEYDAEWEIVE